MCEIYQPAGERASVCHTQLLLPVVGEISDRVSGIHATASSTSPTRPSRVDRRHRGTPTPTPPSNGRGLYGTIPLSRSGGGESPRRIGILTENPKSHEGAETVPVETKVNRRRARGLKPHVRARKTRWGQV